MLHIQTAIKGVQRLPNSPSVSFLTIAGLAPSSCYDLVNLTQEYSSFYLYLPSINEERDARGPASIYPDIPEGVHGFAGVRATMLDTMSSRKRDSNGDAADASVLIFKAYETTSNALPLQVQTKEELLNNIPDQASKMAGMMESYAIKNRPELKNASSETEALRRMDPSALAKVRIGNGRISVVDLAKIYIELIESNDKMTGERTLVVDLMDYSVTPNKRGEMHLILRVIPLNSLFSSTMPSSINQVEIDAGVAKLASSTQMRYTDEVFEKTIQRSIDLREPYTRAYFRMFPPMGNERVAQIARGVGSGIKFAVVRTADAIEIPTPLQASAANTVNMHLITTNIDGDVYLPAGYYYREPVNPKFITYYHHEGYLAPVLDTMCYHFKTTSRDLARVIHDYLDFGRKKYPSSAPYCSLEMLAALRIVVYFIIHPATGWIYRMDYHIGSGKGLDHIIAVVEDFSNDLLFGMVSEDCDGFEKGIQAIIYIVLHGVVARNQESQRPPKWLERDALWRLLDSVLKTGNQGKSVLASFGSWNHPGLDAIQRLLLYYTALSVVGATAETYTLQEVQDTGSIKIRVSDLDHLDREDRNEVAKLYMKTKDINSFICHKWTTLLPIQEPIKALANTIRQERSASSVRYKQDDLVADKILALDKVLTQATNTLPKLPPLLAEATMMANGFALNGGSCYLPPDSPDLYRLRSIEALNRKHVLLMRNGSLDKGALLDEDEWYERGVVIFDEGKFQRLPGDDPERRFSHIYKMMTCADIPLFNELLNTESMSVAFVTPDGTHFGVEMEDIVVSGKRTPNYGLVLSHHRVPLNLRTEYRNLADIVQRWSLPAQLCVYNRSNIRLFKPPFDPSSSSFDPFAIFSRTMMTANANIISPEDLIRLENEVLSPTRVGNLLRTEEKLQPYGPGIIVYTYEPKLG